MGPQEPYWRTNTSFSPPPSRWDFRFQPEGLSFGSNEEIQLYGSSTSSNSRESRSWLRGNHIANHQYSASEGAGPYFSSPSEISPAHQWTPPIIQEINIDDYGSSSRRGQLSFSPAMEGILAVQDGNGSSSSRSDSSGYESVVKSHSSQRNYSGRRYFKSKPIHPLSIPSEIATRETIETRENGFSEFDATSQRDRHHVSGGSHDVDFTDASEAIESDTVYRPYSLTEGFRCGLCERYLSQRSPWSSRRIVRSGDMPIAGVLSCRHIFHAECLDQTTPKVRRSDPPCPLCARTDEDSVSEHRACSKLRNSIPRLRPFREDGPSKPWGCAQAGDCVEGALHTPPRNTMLLINRSRSKNLPLKGNLGKDFPGKLRKSNTFSSQSLTASVDPEAVGSDTTGSSTMK